MTRSSLFILVLTPYLTTASPGVAQSVRGRITEQRDGEPVPFVRVELLTVQRTIAARARTADDGTYELQAPRPGTYQLRVEDPGHRPLISEPITLAEGDSVEVSPSLSPLPYLEGFYRRRRVGGGTFLTRNEIDRTSPRRISDLIGRLVGFVCSYDDFGTCRISNERSFHADCLPLVYVDELRMGATRDFYVDLIPPAWLGAIEVHPSPATMPPELKVSGAACGLILLWTLR